MESRVMKICLLLPLIDPDSLRFSCVLISSDYGLIVLFGFLVSVEGFLLSSVFCGEGVFYYFTV